MSPRAFWNSFKEGFQGMVRHPLVMIASITTILLMLLIISVFTIFSANSRFIMDNVKKQPPIEVYLKMGVSQEEVDPVLAYLNERTDLIHSHILVTPEQHYVEFQEALGENADILEGLDFNSFVPYMIRIQLVDPGMAKEVQFDMAGFQAVQKVKLDQDVMVFLSQATRLVNIGTVIAFAVLLAISLFVISNMVRISVYARSEEIAIMKYIGATTFYIRLPYIIEGVITGLLSAVCAWGIVYFLYERFYVEFQRSEASAGVFTLLTAQSLSSMILIVCVLTGVLIGAFGSAISVRKYVQV